MALKSDLFLDEVFSDFDWPTRFLYVGLCALADRDGIVIGSPKALKIKILPYDNCNIHDLLLSLESGGYLTQLDGVIKLTGFEKKTRGRKKKSDDPQETIEDF